MHPLLQFRQPQLLNRALTHRSYVNENPEAEKDNERLEFLGDALLTFLCGEYLYQHPQYPEMGEDDMTRHRAALVNEKQLAQFAIAIALDDQIRLGKGARREGGAHNANLLSSAFEAVVGAYYLDHDGNIDAVRQQIIPLFESVTVDQFETYAPVDSKNRFQQWVQARGITTPPRYETVRISGEDHAPEWLATVYVDKQKYGQGTGKTKKEAQKRAAEKALSQIEAQNS